MKIKYIPLSPHAMPPVKLSETDSAYSLFTPQLGEMTLHAFDDCEIAMKFKLIIPEGHVGKVHTPPPLIGQTTFCVNDNIIESGSDEEVVLRLLNRSGSVSLTMPPGQRIAILTIEKVEKVEFVNPEDE